MFVTGQKINLRDLRLSDAKPLFENIFHNRNVLKYFIASYFESYQEYLPTFIRLLEISKMNQNLIMVITNKEDELIGLIIEQNHEAEEIELGYCLGESYWNKGYMTQALMAALCYISQNTKYNEVVCAYLEGNEASKKVLEKSGFDYDHKEIKAIDYRGEKFDTIYYRFKIR